MPVRTPDPCTRPPGHPTGTHPAYNAGCRCPDSREAHNAYRRRLRRAESYGRRERQVYVDGTAAREKMALMRERGLSNEQIARACGISSSSVYDHLDRDPSDPKRRDRVRLATAQLIAEATVPTLVSDLHRDQVPSIGTARRLRALSALGWGLKTLSAECGVHNNQLAALRRQRWPRVSRDTHERIAAVYDRLWNTEPARTTQPQRTAVTQARIYAADQGWLPPMAWDDAGIDDPSYTPDVTALRPVTGPSAADKLASFIDLLDHGLPQAEAAERAGYNRTDSAETALRRAGRSVQEWPQCRPDADVADVSAHAVGKAERRNRRWYSHAS